MKEENVINIQLYSLMIGLIVFVVMKYFLKKDIKNCQNTSTIIGSLVVIYIVLFGLGLPTEVNRNIF